MQLTESERRLLEQEIFAHFPYTKLKFLGFVVSFAQKDDLDEYQKEFRFDEEGNPLVGKEHGKWQPNWFVIGVDLAYKVAIFVDLGQKDFPIYIASQHNRHWQSECIAKSFLDYMTILRWIGQLEIEASVQTRKELISSIKKLSAGNVYLNYWVCGLQVDGTKEERFF